MGTTGWAMAYDEREVQQRIAEVQKARGVTEDYVVTDEPGTISQTTFQRNLGEHIARARAGEHVRVHHHGRPDVVMLSEQEYRDLQRDIEEMRAAQGK